jgi:hypothetical protein
LFKVTNVDSFTTKRLTKKHPLWKAFEQIKNIHSPSEKNVTKAFSGFIFNSTKSDFNQTNQTLYIYVAGDGEAYITKSLKTFSENYTTLKGWGIKRWKQMY